MRMRAITLVCLSCIAKVGVRDIETGCLTEGTGNYITGQIEIRPNVELQVQWIAAWLVRVVVVDRAQCVHLAGPSAFE